MRKLTLIAALTFTGIVGGGIAAACTKTSNATPQVSHSTWQTETREGLSFVEKGQYSQAILAFQRAEDSATDTCTKAAMVEAVKAADLADQDLPDLPSRSQVRATREYFLRLWLQNLKGSQCPGLTSIPNIG